MDCLKSFNVGLKYHNTYSVSDISKIWTTNQGGYFINDPNFIEFNLEGFKNINIYGVKMNGDITSDIDGSANNLVRDFSIQLKLNGQTPIIGNSFASGGEFYNIFFTGENTQIFLLSKYNACLDFATPYQSVRSLSWENLRVSGSNKQSNTEVSVDVILNFTFYYKFEGE